MESFLSSNSKPQNPRAPRWAANRQSQVPDGALAPQGQLTMCTRWLELGLQAWDGPAWPSIYKFWNQSVCVAHMYSVFKWEPTCLTQSLKLSECLSRAVTLIWQQSQLLSFTTDNYKYAVKGKLCFVRTLISSFKFFLWLFALSNWCPAKLDWHFSSTGFEFRLVGFWLLASWVCCSKLLLAGCHFIKVAGNLSCVNIRCHSSFPLSSENFILIPQ